MQIESGDMIDFGKEDKDRKKSLKTMKFGKGEPLEYNIDKEHFEKW
jgi:hypothetical protein